MKGLKKILLFIGITLLLSFIGLGIWITHNWRDRHPGYEVALNIQAKTEKAIFKVGFGRAVISPTVTDTWTDVNGDARYKTEDGDTYQDVNGNGKFDAVWIAGFSNAKPANGLHDDLWARTVVVDDGATRMALVSIDVVGFMYNDVVDIRKAVPESLGIDYVLISATHTHEGNDMIGIWGPSEFKSGVDPEHMGFVKTQILASITDAAEAAVPAKLVFAQDLSGRDSILIKDTRKPIVKATGIHVMHALDAAMDTTLGMLINWANHPETLWDRNLLISSDFPHYLRESIEKGIWHEGELIQEAYGGTAVFFNGAIGGLMTPYHSLPFRDPIRDSTFAKPSFEKTRTLGEQIALLSAEALSTADTLESLAGISLQAKSLMIPLDNTVFRIAAGIGLIQRGFPKYFHTRTEVAAFRIGPAGFLSIPGEIYPEIILGGIESPPGQDFAIDPVEIPPLQEKFLSPYKFYFGLSNDELGYIIPKSEWDNEAPWLYLDENDTYGEENSPGPETAPILYEALSDILKKLYSHESPEP